MKEKKLLIVHHGSLGDLVVTFPAVIKLKKNFALIDLLCKYELGKLSQTLNVVEGCFPLEAASFSSLFSDSVDKTVKEILCKYDEIILFSRSSQLKETINKITRKKIYRILPRPKTHKTIHVSEHILFNLIRCGLIEESDRNFDLFLFSGIDYDRRHTQSDQSRVLIHPGSGSKKKIWPVSNFIKIASILESKNMRPEFILGPAEHYLEKILQRQDEYNRKIHIIDNLMVLALLLKKAGGFIGNDSGVSHLAAFLGLPTVAVFGPSDPERWKPIGRTVRIVRPVLECSPCFETEEVNCKELDCLKETSPEAVADEFLGLL